MSRKGVLGLTSQIKDKLIQQALERRLRSAGDTTGGYFRPMYGAGQGAAARQPEIPEQFYRFHLHPGYQQIRIINDGAARLGSAAQHRLRLLESVDAEAALEHEHDDPERTADRQNVHHERLDGQHN